MERITSRENSRIKQLCKLIADKKERVRTGLFVTEGARLSNEASLCGVKVLTLLVTEQAKERYAEQVDRLMDCADELFEIPLSLAQRIGDTQNPQGVYCVCAQPEQRLTDTPQAGRYLAIESVQDPGNLGTILRSADAFSLSGVYLSADCADIWSPKVLRAAMGSTFRVPVHTAPNFCELLSSLSSTHETYAAVLDTAAVSVRNCEFSGSTVVAIGNEGGGLTPAAIAACKHHLFIDMPGGAESLNAGVASSIIMWEMARPAVH